MGHDELEKELQQIEEVLGSHPDGIGISDLLNELASSRVGAPNRRTLQRRLKRLLTEHRIVSEGTGASTTYKPVGLVQQGGVVVEALVQESEIPISEEGKQIRLLIQRPIQHRKPVGYQRSFLDEYQPGVTFYLPKSLREQLHLLGRTSDKERPAGTYARDMMNRLLIDLSWASSHLEGNTYDRLDTQNLIESGKVAEGKDLKETQMILNHKGAIEMLIEDAGEIDFNPFTFQNLHAILSENLLHDENACGRLRQRPVEISGSVFHPLAMPQLLEDCFRLMLQKASAIPDPFEQAFFVMVQLPYLQPFEDVNKRVSRLGANIPLIKHNLCPLSFIDVPETIYIDATLAIYELNQFELLRDVFVWVYKRSCQRYLAVTHTMAEPDIFRMQYRESLIQVVRRVVQEKLVPEDRRFEKLLTDGIPKEDQAKFKTMIFTDLQRLHEGSVVRYRLRLSEYMAWESLQARFFRK